MENENKHVHNSEHAEEIEKICEMMPVEEDL